MLYSGLVSITFRKISSEEIVELVHQAGLDGIEWGGDIHVPHGDLAKARDVRKMTEDAGLKVTAYGSYYRAGHDNSGPFEAVLDTAVELGAPLIRIWAGKQGTDTADEAYYTQVIEDSRRIADLAANAGIPLAYEFHGNTLTDTNHAAKLLLESVAHDNVISYWQPPCHASVEYNLEGIEAVLSRLSHVHVFNWHIDTCERLPLVDAENKWRQYLTKISTTKRDHFAMIEFVKDDAPGQFLQDAAALKRWVRDLNMRYYP